MKYGKPNNKTQPEKYKNKYRIKSIRLKYWDYGSNGFYFITICTKNKKYFFGEISDDKMNLSEIGKMVEKYWLEIPQHFSFVNLGEFVVMPNHIHGIIEIAKTNNECNIEHNNNVETQNFASLQSTTLTTTTSKNKFGPQSKNLASIIRGFKIGVTINARKINPDFQWQSRYYDHIIRNEKSFIKISEYIQNNPINWQDDELYVGE